MKNSSINHFNQFEYSFGGAQLSARRRLRKNQRKENTSVVFKQEFHLETFKP